MNVKINDVYEIYGMLYISRNDARCRHVHCEGLWQQLAVDEPVLTTNELMRRLGVEKYAGETCAICLRGMNRRAYVLPCDHKFHGKCIRKWFDKDCFTCPTCRGDATLE